jgi:hypothetical protein
MLIYQLVKFECSVFLNQASDFKPITFVDILHCWNLPSGIADNQRTLAVRRG